jgi:2-keto-4-pentenoate hydratase
MTKESRQRAARLLADAWLAGATIDLPAALLPADRAAAYAIQDEIARLLAADPANAVAGWKVGATSAGVQKAEGYDGPIPGRVFASMVYASEAELPPSRCSNAAIEAEIAFLFAAAPRMADKPHTWTSLADYVALLPAFDITGTRYSLRCRTDWDGRQKMLAGIADNGNGGAVVLGAPAADWQMVDLMQLAPALRVNGGDPAAKLRGDARTDPRDALVWTVNHVYARGFTLAAGDVVLTGSLIQPQPLQAGDRAVCRFPGLGGSLSCQISRA